MRELTYGNQDSQSIVFRDDGTYRSSGLSHDGYWRLVYRREQPKIFWRHKKEDEWKILDSFYHSEIIELVHAWVRDNEFHDAVDSTLETE
jgi:hypothetical protein